MKIACQSCQAKYTIADEKVVGKVVKIRCKKCGSTIVVNGQEGGSAGPPDEPTEIRSTTGEFGAAGGGEAEGWTVNVADNDQRTMTTQQVVTEFQAGVVTDETYCWRDGMGDWLPLREIEELATACGLNAAAAATAAEAPRAAAGGGGALAGIFGSSPAAAAQPAAARRARTGGADLFGAAAEAGGENDVMTSATGNTAARADESKMKGERNENSVLFSLNSLTANAPKGANGDSPAGKVDDGSGLIDIRALSSSMSSSGGPKKPNHVDDIMNLGGGGAFSAALAAPVLTAPTADAADPASPAAAASNKKMMTMFGGLAGLLILGMVGMYFALKPPPVAPGQAGAGETAAATAPATSGAAAAGGTSAATTAAAAAGTAPPTAADPGAVAANDTKAAAPAVGVQPRHGGGGHTTTASEPVAQNTPPPPPGPAPGLDALMKASVHAENAPSAPAAPAGGTAPFDRGAASAALGAIADSVASCKKPNGPTGDGHVQITFSPNGSVVSAIVDQPPFAGTAVGGCVAGKFRGAHVPAFAGGNLTIGKRFSIN